MTVEFENSVCAPKSLDVKFFQEVLENYLLEDSFTIKKISFEMGSDVGDNFCSQIYRVRVMFQRGNEPRLESVSVIVKSIQLTEHTKFLEHLGVFLKEKIIFNQMLPRMEILLDGVKFGSKLYYTHKEPIKTLVFEDLSALGYVMANREDGLDIGHCQLVMRKLGQFHATSMILFKKEPETRNLFQTGFLAEAGINGSDAFEVFFGNNLHGLIEIASKWNGYESITAKMKKYAADFKQNLINSQLPIPGELKVLNHGDLWINNTLFKYTEGDRKKVEDVIFVDFQMSIYGSPGYDINYFLFTSIHLDVLKEKREELLTTYYMALCEVLNAYGYKDVPSFKDILLEVRRRELYGFFAHYGLFPMMAMDKTKSKDNTVDNFMDGNFAKRKLEVMFSSKRVEETMKYTLKRFDELDVFD